MTTVPHWLLKGRILQSDGQFRPGVLGVEGDRIVAVSDMAALPQTGHILDAGEGWIVPGFIEMQINGAFGHDFTMEPDSVVNVAAQLPRYGVTSFLPTVVTSDWPSYPERLARAAQPSRSGARNQGLHVEGPFLNPAKKGAHPPQHIRPPAPADVETILTAAPVRLLTLAPEMPGGLEAVRAARAAGAIVSAGHSLATLEQAREAFAAGVTYATHLLNAMPQLDSRKAGLPLAVLHDPAIVAGLIADGVHIHPEMVRLIYRLKGKDGINLVTDAMGAMGQGAGEYVLSDHKVTVDATSARLADGTLAGSILTLDQAVRNLMAFAGCSLADAINTVTRIPARLLGMEREIGTLAPGALADVVMLDAQYRISLTLVGGQIAYQRD